MKITCRKEMLTLTKKEFEILCTARDLLDDIYGLAVHGGFIERNAGDAMECICDLLDDDNCEIEIGEDK